MPKHGNCGDPLLEMEAEILALENLLDKVSGELEFDSYGNSWPLHDKETVELENVLNELQDNYLRVQGLMPWPITKNTDTILS